MFRESWCLLLLTKNVVAVNGGLSTAFLCDRDKQQFIHMENENEERELYKKMYDDFMHKYEILAYYSKIILNMFLSLKIVSRVMNEITCSWRVFKNIIKDVLK